MPRIRLATLLFIAFCLVAALALTWPGHALLGDLLATRVVGVPFALAWNVGWVLAMLGALTAYHFAIGDRD